MPGFGLRLARSQGMEGSTGNQREFPIAPGFTTAIYKGDLVALNGGNVEAVKAVGDAPIGVFWGCKYVDPDGDTVFSPQWTPDNGGAGRTRTECLAQVMVASGNTFLIEANPALVAGDVGKLATAATAAVPGDSRTGQSRMVATLAATGPLTVISVPDLPNGDGTPSNIIEVALNLNALFGDKVA